MKKILIVDDDYAIRRLYQEELSDEGYRVIVTASCEDIMERIERYMPDLIILDIMMGQFHGLEILQKIRNSHYDLPVILCSAYSMFKHDLRSIAADYYVTKGADLSELKFRIKMALENRDPGLDTWHSKFHEIHKNHLNGALGQIINNVGQQ